MLAFHGDAELKAAKLAQLRDHEAADEIVKGQYWESGRGCAVGCTVHSSDHRAYEVEMGIPVMLARLEDRLFEGMPNADAKRFPVRFIDAIQPGADLSLVGWKFLHWLISDVTEAHGTEEKTKAACADAIEILRRKSIGEYVSMADASAARDKARRAADAADDDAAYAAAYAADDAAAAAAYAAAYAAAAAAYAAADAFHRQSEKLLELLASAPVPAEAIAA